MDYDSQEASRGRTPSPGTRRVRRPALSGEDCQWRRGWWDREHGCTWGLRGRSGGGGEPGLRGENLGWWQLQPAPCGAPAGLSRRPRLALTLAPRFSANWEAGTRESPGSLRPAGLRAPPGDSLCPAAPSWTQRTIRLESLPEKECCSYLGRARGRAASVFISLPEGFAQALSLHI